jgi:hypothetical protein
MKDHLKAMAGYFRKSADSHREHAESARTRMNCCKGLSEVAKATGLFKGDKEDFHEEMSATYAGDADRHDADAERCSKMAEHCEKLAGELPAGKQGSDGRASGVELNLDGDASAKLATQVVDALRKEFGDAIIPSQVKGVLPENPLAPGPGLTLVGRSGGPTTPTDMSKISPEFQNLFRE